MGAWVRVAKADNGVATVALDRAHKRNALDSAVMHELIGVFQSLSAWEELRVVLLTSADPTMFIAGADVKQMAGLDAASARTFITLVHRCCRAVIECPVPVVARIAGHALGAGLELAAACDLRIAGLSARFAMPEVRLGMPSVVEAALLPRLVGAGRARWLVYTGATIDAEKALQWGLVEEAVPENELDAAVERTVALLLAAGPHALRAQKRLCVAWDEAELRQAVDASIETFAGLWEGSVMRKPFAGGIDRKARS